MKKNKFHQEFLSKARSNWISSQELNEFNYKLPKFSSQALIRCSDLIYGVFLRANKVFNLSRV
ncbi:hypothetical protein KY285_025897 [Solanum tuberosum]|nr:hypothetical protein KY285_025897 [Solanum tuberosum]